MAADKLKENIEHLMQLHGIKSVMELARRTQTPQPTLHHILSGATRSPRRKSLIMLAEFFGVNVDQLIGNEPLPHVLPDHILAHLNIQVLPIIEWHQAKHWPMPMVREQDNINKIVIDATQGQNAFAIELHKTIRAPLFVKHALVVFDPDKQPDIEQYVLVYLAKQDAIEVCQLMHKSSTYQVKIVRTEQTIELEPYQDRLLATVTEVRVRF
jgi:transcriptional regulator with XRE-family HTH domain